jgi:hypothetical protein
MQQQQQHVQPLMGPAPLGVADAIHRINNEPLQPWMVRYKAGAVRALMQLTPDGGERDYLVGLVNSQPDKVHTSKTGCHARGWGDGLLDWVPGRRLVGMACFHGLLHGPRCGRC